MFRTISNRIKFKMYHRFVRSAALKPLVRIFFLCSICIKFISTVVSPINKKKPHSPSPKLLFLVSSRHRSMITYFFLSSFCHQSEERHSRSENHQMPNLVNALYAIFSFQTKKKKKRERKKTRNRSAQTKNCCYF